MKKQFVLEISEYGKVVRKMEDSNHKRFMEETERIMLNHLRNHCRQAGDNREDEVKNINFHIYTFQ